MSKSSPALSPDDISSLPWHVRQALHTRLLNRHPRVRIARWLLQQFTRFLQRDDRVKICCAALSLYCAGDEYQNWLSQSKRSAVIRAMVAANATSGQRLALSVVVEKLRNHEPPLNKAADTGLSGL